LTDFKEEAETRAKTKGRTTLFQQVLLKPEHDRRKIFGVNCLRKIYTTSATH
jgi:hypothetical protein